MNKGGVDAVLSRLMELLGVASDSELARALDVNRQTLASWRKRESVPYSICVNLSEEKNISLDWLLTGRGAAYVGTAAQPESSATFSQSDLKLLELMNQLDPDVRRDLLRGAEEKQRIIDMEKQLRDLSAELERVKKTG
ncbi:helix-turn-helix domain-containing protein [Pectobacterium polaris]|uniref:Helix-turn-helix domain-containing protein n=1 Tax=Pectobacterium polaris TaxID=2042057 RepID=A0AAW4P0Z8_9GAMM|nr:helix-turn-helix domain-containing protein [Pectobacterium polaris]MBW5893135.1 helix-turn-helix domain-containing protein [Pectobacterium polaris]